VNEKTLMKEIKDKTNSFINYIFEYRYVALLIVLFCKVAINATNGIWVDDFWEHSANVSEFMARPFNTEHPFFAVQNQHSYLNPYSYLVAITGLLLRINSIEALALFSVINMFLLSWGLKKFIETIHPTQSADISFYCLLLTLFFWGSNPWPASGFFNQDIILTVLPLPSAFVAATSFIGLFVNYKRLKQGSFLLDVSLVLIISISVLSHPLTSIFLILGLIAQTITIKVNLNNEIIRLVILFFVSGLICISWPFFSIFALLTGEGGVYHLSNHLLYENLLTRAWPTIVSFPLIINLLRKPRYKTILWMLCSLLTVYIAGYFLHKYAYGRTLSYVFFLIHIMISIVIVRNENILRTKFKTIPRIFNIVLLVILLSFIAQNLAMDARRLLTIANSIRLGRAISNQTTYRDYVFLKEYLKQREIVLANSVNSYLIPSFGGRVIATYLPVAFLPDIEQRRLDIKAFFECSTTMDNRLSIIKKYNAQYLLLDKKSDICFEELKNDLLLSKQFEAVYEGDRFLLVKIFN